MKMAQAREALAPRKRERCSSDDDWTVVGKSRKKKPSQPIASSRSTKINHGPGNRRPWFCCSASEHFPTAFHVVKKVEETFSILFNAKPRANGQFLIQPTDDRSLRILSVTREIDGKRLHIKIVQKEALSLQKAVICGFPQELGLCLLSRLEEVCTPVRMKSRAGAETKQVSVFFKGEIPKYIDLGSWGRFSVRPFVPEPLRCFKCQRWGHHQRHCKLPTKCGVCSGAHDTTACIKKHKSAQTTTACCPNCGGKHHAWNLSCPSRRALIQKLKSPRPQQNQKQEGSKEELNQRQAEKAPIRKKKRRTRKPKVKPSKQPVQQKEQQRPTMKKKIVLEGNVVSKSTGVDPGPKQSIPAEKLRPLMLHVAEEVADATKGNLDRHTLEMLVQTALLLHGIDPVYASSQDAVPVPFVSALPPEKPRRQPWLCTEEELSSAAESDIDLYDISDYP